MSTGLSGRLASLDKQHPAKPAREKSAKPTPAPAAGASRSAKTTPKAGANRTITIRHLTDDDLKRLAEFRYTHNLTIQDIAIQGMSIFLRSKGLAPLSAFVPDESEGEG